MRKLTTNFKQLGVSGLRRQGGYVYEEFMPKLRWPYAADIYQEMGDNDPVIGSVLYLAEMLIRNTDWEVTPASDKPVDIAAAKFLKECMDDMDTSWADNISEIISMLQYGFSLHEVIYKVRRGRNESNGKYRSKYSDGRIGWRRMPIRSQASLHEWVFDDDGDIKGFVQLALPSYKPIEIPLDRGLLFRTRVNRDNPEGKSLLRNAYRPWYFKKRIEEIEGIGIERDLAGLPVLQAPEGMDLWDERDERMVALKANAENLVSSIRRDGEEGVLLPAGWDLKLLSSGSSRQFDTNSIINRYDNRIAITMLSDLILIGGEKTGSFALAEAKQSLLASALSAQIWNISDIFNNYAVPKLFKLNNFEGLTDLPRIEPAQMISPALKEVALLLRAMGVDISKDMELQNYLRKISSLPEMDKETFENVYATQSEEKKADPNANTKKDDFNDDDTVENDLEQNDMRG
ncbi:hypothetical protein D3C79_574010 [compost metagenome]